MIGRKSEGYQELSQGLMSGQDREDSRTGFGSEGPSPYHNFMSPCSRCVAYTMFAVDHSLFTKR